MYSAHTSRCSKIRGRNGMPNRAIPLTTNYRHLTLMILVVLQTSICASIHLRLAVSLSIIISINQFRRHLGLFNCRDLRPAPFFVALVVGDRPVMDADMCNMSTATGPRTRGTMDENVVCVCVCAEQ